MGDLPAVGSLWRHYKGTLYRVVGHARNANTGESGVLYEPADGHQGPPWFHTLFDWCQWVALRNCSAGIATDKDMTRRFIEVQ